MACRLALEGFRTAWCLSCKSGRSACQRRVRLCDWPAQWQELIGAHAHVLLLAPYALERGVVHDPGATDLAAQLALVPTVTSLREFTRRADAQAQRRRQLNTLWRAAHTYWRAWLAARIDQFMPHLPPDYDDSLLLRDAATEQKQPSPASTAKQPPPFCGLPNANIYSLCQTWLRGVGEQEQAAAMRQLVEFVHTNSGIVDKPLALPTSSSSALLHQLLIDVCAHVKKLVTDRAYNGELWPILERKIRIHIGRRCFSRVQAEHEQCAAIVAVTTNSGDDGSGAPEESTMRLGGTYSEHTR